MAIPGEVVNQGGVPKGLLREAMRGILPEAIRNRRWKADFTAFGNQAVAAEYPVIVDLLTRDSCAVRAGLVDPSIVERELAVFKTRLSQTETAVAGWRMAELAGLELWLREFFGPQLGGRAENRPSLN
jgi:asparagine synthase (glutamine-hydrolysing)